MVKWGYQEGPDTRECGESQSDEHLIKCVIAPPGCTTDNLALTNENYISIATHWPKQNVQHIYILLTFKYYLMYIYIFIFIFNVISIY